MKIKFLSLSFLISGISIISSAQVVYSLNDCIKIALERNFSLLISRNRENIASNNYTLGNAGYLPSIDLTSRHNGTVTSTNQNLIDGSSNESKGVHNTGTSALINADITIFNGFSVKTNYKKLNELKQVGELNTRMSVENLLAEIISGYYNYVQQVEILNNIKYAVSLSKERLRIDEDRYLLGSSSKLQVLQSRVYLNADSSRLTRQNEIVRGSRIRLNELMAVDNLALEFVTSDTSIAINPGLIYEKLMADALNQNTSLLLATKDVVISGYDYKLIKSRSYPYLNASSGYNYSFNDYSSGTMQNQSSRGLNYGLTMGINIFDGLNQRREIRNSSIEMTNKELQYKEIEQGIRADLITIYNAYSNYLRLVNLEQQNLQTAAENLEIAMERYKLGSLSGIDLREVQKSLLDAKESLISVEYQAKLAEVSLMLISGRISDYYQ
ncbi:MAG: TolC family protein [Bacteroidales bacterium]|nr:TolC family protein [Bacteroidales bacterium]